MAAGKKKPRISREDALELLFALAVPPEAETVPVMPTPAVSTSQSAPTSRAPAPHWAASDASMEWGSREFSSISRTFRRM